MFSSVYCVDRPIVIQITASLNFHGQWLAYINRGLSGRTRLVSRDLSVVIDSQLSLSAHVAAVCRSGYYQLRQLRQAVSGRCLKMRVRH